MEGSSVPKATVFEKLNALNVEIEAGILGFNGSRTDGRKKDELSMSTEFDSMKEKAYIERTPEAQHALLLFRKYTSMVKEQQRYDAGEGSDIRSGGFWDPDLTMKDPMKQYGRYLEGSSDSMAGEAATKQHIFAMKLSVSVFSFLAFVIMCANADIQEPDLTPAIMTTPQCYLWQNGYGAEGAFNMRTYQLVIALAFFNWLNATCWCVYYYLPINEETGHKFIPGCGDVLERFMHKADFDDNARTSTRKVTEDTSLFCFRKSKLANFLSNACLSALTALVLIIASIDIERGAEFVFQQPTSVYSAWYTIGTFHLTFSHGGCIDKPDPSDSVRAGLAMSYISLFYLVLCTIITYDSYRKQVKKEKEGDQDRDGVLPEHFEGGAAGGGGDKKGLMAHADAHDDDDDVVDVKL